MKIKKPSVSDNLPLGGVEETNGLIFFPKALGQQPHFVVELWSPIQFPMMKTVMFGMPPIDNSVFENDCHMTIMGVSHISQTKMDKISHLGIPNKISGFIKKRFT